jgi:hypothetical protein
VSDASNKQPSKHREGVEVGERGAVNEVSDLKNEKHFFPISLITSCRMSDVSNEQPEKQ